MPYIRHTSNATVGWVSVYCNIAFIRKLVVILTSFQSILRLCYHIHLVVYDTSKCHCEHKNGMESENGIACEREGYFQHTLKCPSNQWCTGPYNTSGATEIQSLDEFCSKGKLSNIRYTFWQPKIWYHCFVTLVGNFLRCMPFITCNTNQSKTFLW